MAGERGPSARIVEVEKDEFIKRAEGQKKLGIFGIDDLTEGKAREIKLQLLVQELEKYNRGWEGNSRQCPKCGEKQLYKGDQPRKLRVTGGTVEIDRAYYVCKSCKHSSFPMDDALNLAPELEQGRLRERISILGAIVPYNQIPELSIELIGMWISACTVRRCLLKEVELLTSECPVKELKPSNDDVLYAQLDGFMIPTREERKDKEDQGYRESKVATVFTAKARVEVSKDRNQITDQLIAAKICSAKEFESVFKDLARRSNYKKASRVVVLSDGAKWIQNLARRVLPCAIQILDYAHAKQHLHAFAKLKFGESNNGEIFRFVDEMKGLLWEDRAPEVTRRMFELAGEDPLLLREAKFFRSNQQRMRYKKFRAEGLDIGSGAIESLGKRIGQGRLKGAGMRWNVKDVNPVLFFRAALFDGRVKSHLRYQRVMEEQYFQRLVA